MKKDKKKIVILVVIIACVLCAMGKNNNDDYLAVDSKNFFYERDVYDMQDAPPNFYATLHTNRLKSVIEGEVINANMEAMIGYNLNDIVCVLQMVKNKYIFSEEQKKEIEIYLRSLQQESVDGFIVAGSDELAMNNENIYFYTAEALEICEVLDIELLYTESIAERLSDIKLDSDSPKVTASLVKMDRLLNTKRYSEAEIFEVYRKLYQKWENSEEAGLEWIFDIYYLSFIYKYGELEDALLYEEFESDVSNILKHADTDLTIKTMFLEVCQNYGMVSDDIKSSLEECVEQIEEYCSLGGNTYSVYMGEPGNINATYYVYLYNKCIGQDYFNIDHYNYLKDIFVSGDYVYYSPQEIMQSLYIIKSNAGKIDFETQELVSFLEQQLETADNVQNLYFYLSSLKIILGEEYTPEEDIIKNIQEVIRAECDYYKEVKGEVYEKNLSLFFSSIIMQSTPYNEYGELEEIVKSMLMQQGTYLTNMTEDLRITYFYYVACCVWNMECELAQNNLHKYCKDGLYYIGATDTGIRSIMLQYMGEVIRRECVQKPYI